MRPGPPRGTTATLDITVTADMASSVTGRSTGATYGTRALLGHVERICRQIVEPHLEAGELAIDVAIEVRHREPVPVGDHITLEATVASVEPTKVICEVMVRSNGTVVARGTLEQAIVRED